MELALRFIEDKSIEVGLDEAGRGCIAGPVFAAAAILNEPIEGLNDSKKLNQRQREELETEIKKKALDYSIGICDQLEIDKINILNASILAMHKSLDKLNSPFDRILVDGNRFKPFLTKEFHTIIKGDGKFQSIAAASILAKCARDRFMLEIHEEFPEYNWKSNKGYPSIEHRKAIMRIGACPYHRKSFKLLPDHQLDIFNKVK